VITVMSELTADCEVQQRLPIILRTTAGTCLLYHWQFQAKQLAAVVKQTSKMLFKPHGGADPSFLSISQPSIHLTLQNSLWDNSALCQVTVNSHAFPGTYRGMARLSCVKKSPLCFRSQFWHVNSCT